MRKRLGIALGVAAAGVLALGAQGAAAATIEVTNTNDSGAGSLRRAIQHANRNGEHFDKIPINVTGTITLRRSLPRLRSDLAIRGPGARKLTVRGKDKRGWSVFYNLGSRTISVSGISIVGARDAVLSRHAGRFSVSRTVLRDDNPAIYTLGRFSRVDVSRSTLSNNRYGIVNDAGTTTISRSTVSGARRGAIGNAYGTVAVSQSTLSGNSTKFGTGAGIVSETGETTLESTVIANSSGGNCGGLPGSKPVVTSLGHNLADDGTCNLTAEGDQPNTDPLLRPLDYYGGPTKTFALLPTSPAVDAGFAGDTPKDQRGFLRKVDYPGVPKAVGSDNSDVGSFELQAP
jgi:hypothetical protein